MCAFGDSSTNLRVKSSYVSMLTGDVDAQLIRAVFDIKIAHVTHSTCIEVQQLMTEQRIEATELYLAYL